MRLLRRGQVISRRSPRCGADSSPLRSAGAVARMHTSWSDVDVPPAGPAPRRRAGSETHRAPLSTACAQYDIHGSDPGRLRPRHRRVVPPARVREEQPNIRPTTVLDRRFSVTSEPGRSRDDLGSAPLRLTYLGVAPVLGEVGLGVHALRSSPVGSTGAGVRPSGGPGRSSSLSAAVFGAMTAGGRTERSVRKQTANDAEQRGPPRPGPPDLASAG
jgi:hypothetical protein